MSSKTEWKLYFCRFVCSFFFCPIFFNNRNGILHSVVLSAEKGWMMSLWSTWYGDVTEQQIDVLLCRPKFLVSSELTAPSQHFLWFSLFFCFLPFYQWTDVALMKIHKSPITVWLYLFHLPFTPWSSAGLHFKPVMLTMFSSTMVCMQVTLRSPVRAKVHTHPTCEKIFSNFLLLLSGSFLDIFVSDKFKDDCSVFLDWENYRFRFWIENSGGTGSVSVFTQLLTRSYRIILVNRSLYMHFLLLLCISSWEVYINCISTLYK